MTQISDGSIVRPLGPRPSQLRLNFGLARELAVASFRLKYAGSILGYVWSLIKPLLIFGMLFVVFGLFLFRGRPVPGTNFPVELLLGIVLWSFFNEATTSALSSVVFNSDMIKKAYFPRWILVVAATVSSAMTLLVNLALLTVIGLVLRWFSMSSDALWLIPLLAELYILTLGIGLFLGAVYVYYRDLIHIWEVVLQALFYVSVIIFPFFFIPPQYRTMAMLNPVAQIFEDARHFLVSPGLPRVASVTGGLYFIPLCLSCLSFVVGALSFRRLSKRFGERI
jgi:ABC-2 type transport system permease protein